jgi:muramoyltetrapeptide carboxypeptidase LdcA involved in peptidoglycan recycling
MTTSSYPPEPPGDRVAVLSPGAGLPEFLPCPYEEGLERLRGEYGLEPVEYPTTRKMGTTPQERADDIHAAFADPDVKAVFTSMSPMGGVIRYGGAIRVDGAARRITVTC